MFFTLQDGKLRYYKTHNSIRPQSVLDLDHCVISAHPELSSEGHIFEVVSPSDHIIVRVPTREEMVKWINCMNEFTTRISNENRQFEMIQEAIDHVEGWKNSSVESLQKELTNFQSFIKNPNAVSRLLKYLVSSSP